MAGRSHSLPLAERALPLGCGMGLLDIDAAAPGSAGVPGLERRGTVSSSRINPTQNESGREMKRHAPGQREWLESLSLTHKASRGPQEPAGRAPSSTCNKVSSGRTAALAKAWPRQVARLT